MHQYYYYFVESIYYEAVRDSFFSFFKYIWQALPHFCIGVSNPGCQLFIF